MASNKGLDTIDDVIRLMDKMLTEIHKKFSEREMDVRVAQLLSGAKNPDEIFKSRLVMSYMEEFIRISMNLS